MVLSATATLGGLTIEAAEGPERGSDTGWNREISFAHTRNLGSQRDTSLQMALGSHTRSFALFLNRQRFLSFQALQGSVMTFTDWEGNARSVLVTLVQREGNSRPFIYRTSISLLEQ